MTARFVRQENVKHYRRLLETVMDEPERQKILRLLAEEQEKQRAAGDPIIEDGVSLDGATSFVKCAEPNRADKEGRNEQLA